MELSHLPEGEGEEGISRLAAELLFTMRRPQMPSHTHTFFQVGNGGGLASGSDFTGALSQNTGAAGTGQGHNHTFSGSASGGSITGTALFTGSATSQFAVKYINMILCSKS